MKQSFVREKIKMKSGKRVRVEKISESDNGIGREALKIKEIGVAKRLAEKDTPKKVGRGGIRNKTKKKKRKMQ